jgi:bacteriophage CI repressor helix-turn-helix domain
MTENQRLKEIQKKLSFNSQAEFAEFLGIKQGSLSDIYREKKGIGVSDSIKMKLEKEFSINIDWLKTGEGEMIKKEINIDNSQVNAQNSVIGNNITNNKGNVIISFSNEDISKIIEQHKELTERLKTSQEQISVLLEIIKNK